MILEDGPLICSSSHVILHHVLLLREVAIKLKKTRERGHSYQATSTDAISQISPLEIKGSLYTFNTH